MRKKRSRETNSHSYTHPARDDDAIFRRTRARGRPSSVVSRDDDDRFARMPVETTVETPTLDIPAETLWRARTTSLFMTCERAVFGDLDSAIVVYERDDADSNRCRYIVRARPNVRVPYVARMALGAASDGGGVTTYDEFIVDETQCTAPHLYEATVRSYSTFLNPHNSRVVGTVRCASVDGETRCALRLRLEARVRATAVGGVIERAIVRSVREKFALYSRVVEMYKAKRAKIEARRRARNAREDKTRRDDDSDSYHSARDDESGADATESDASVGALREMSSNARLAREVSSSTCCVRRRSRSDGSRRRRQ